jgi:hypothetical protein
VPNALEKQIRKNEKKAALRVMNLVSKEMLVQITKSSIGNLIERFIKTPYFFYTESDLHTFLYSDIYSKLPAEEWLCKTKNRKISMLMHKEYPTKDRYNARTLKEEVSKGSRGHFDLSIWNPEITSDKLIRVSSSSDFQTEQQTFIAIEFDLIERNRTFESALHHLRWDLMKLMGIRNKVEHGYQLVFVRDWVHKNDFVAQAKAEAAEANTTTVLYIETNGDASQYGTLSPKSFLNCKPILN